MVNFHSAANQTKKLLNTYKIQKGEFPGITETERHHCPPQLLEETECLEGGKEGEVVHT